MSRALESPHLLTAEPRDVSLASFLLVTTLIGKLTEAGRLTPEEANFVAALAAHGGRLCGNEAAARIIEETMEGCIGVDVEDVAGEFGVKIEKAQKH